MTPPSPERSPGTRRRTARLIVGAALIVSPWLWFAVRDGSAVFDGFAVGMPVAGLFTVVVLAIVAILRRELLPLLIAISTALALAVAVVGPRLPVTMEPPDPAVRVVAANVSDPNADPFDASRALMARGGDVVVAVEMARGFWDVFSLPRRQAYPFGVTLGEIGVRSRYPVELLEGATAVSGARLLRIRVEAPDGPFVLYAVHALNPLRDTTFGEQRAFIRRLGRAADAETLPVVIAGDLNLSDRAEGYRTLTAERRDAMRAGMVPGNTYERGLWAPVLLRIDHLIIPEDWCAADPGRFAVPGSDHRGREAAVGPCPG
jgi:vancomycin resistance protein VanJ